MTVPNDGPGSLDLPTLNDPVREQLSVLADVLNLADHLGIEVRGANLSVGLSVSINLADDSQGARLAHAIDGDPTVTHRPTDAYSSGHTTWKCVHLGVRVSVHGTVTEAERAS